MRYDIGAGGVGKPGVTGVAYEHPLEGVADGSAGSPTVSVTFRLTKQKPGGGLPHQKFVYYHPTSTGSRTDFLLTSRIFISQGNRKADCELWKYGFFCAIALKRETK